VHRPRIDVAGLGRQGHRVALDGCEERGRGGVEYDVGCCHRWARGRGCLVQADGEGAEAAEGGEAFGVVGVEAGDAAFGTAVEDAGGFEDGGVGDGHGEVAHCVAALADEFGVGGVEWGDSEHGEGVAAGVDGEEVLVGVSEVVRNGHWYTHRRGKGRILTSWETTTAPWLNRPSGPPVPLAVLPSRPLPPVGVKTGLESVPSSTKIDNARRLSPLGLLLRRYAARLRVSPRAGSDTAEARPRLAIRRVLLRRYISGVRDGRNRGRAR